MTTFYPLQSLLLTVAGWLNREQQQVIEYLAEENRVLREQLGSRRLRLTDDQRRRLAVLGKALGRRLLGRFATIVTPDTILRWHRRLIAAKWTFLTSREARPGLMGEIRALVIRMARENSTWGYSRIQGALRDLGHEVGRSTVARILKSEGMKPAPERPTSWGTFLKANWDTTVAADFFSTEVWTPRGLVTHYTLFVIELKSRRVHIAGTTTNPDEAFMAQVARNLTDVFDGFLLGHRFFICDRDTKFTERFRETLKGVGVTTVLTPYRAPNCNAFAERFVRSIKEECLRRMIFFGEASLLRAIREYADHYNGERPHQGVDNRVLRPKPRGLQAPATGPVESSERLGGLLRHYRRSA